MLWIIWIVKYGHLEAYKVVSSQTEINNYVKYMVFWIILYQIHDIVLYIVKWQTVLLQVAYGMTETSPLSFMSVPGVSPEMQVSTVGSIFDHVEVNIFFYNIKGLLKLHYAIYLFICKLSFVMLKLSSSICLGITMN